MTKFVIQFEMAALPRSSQGRIDIPNKPMILMELTLKSTKDPPSLELISPKKIFSVAELGGF